jgi:hypothetical protein
MNSTLECERLKFPNYMLNPLCFGFFQNIPQFFGVNYLFFHLYRNFYFVDSILFDWRDYNCLYIMDLFGFLISMAEVLKSL